jgi:hypothetical protein
VNGSCVGVEPGRKTRSRASQVLGCSGTSHLSAITPPKSWRFSQKTGSAAPGAPRRGHTTTSAYARPILLLSSWVLMRHGQGSPRQPHAESSLDARPVREHRRPMRLGAQTRREQGDDSECRSRGYGAAMIVGGVVPDTIAFAFLSTALPSATWPRQKGTGVVMPIITT